MNHYVVSLGNDAFQLISVGGKDAILDFEMPKIGVRGYYSGSDFSITSGSKISECYSIIIVDSLDSKQTRLYAFSKESKKGYFAVNTSKLYLPGKTRNFYFGGEFDYSILNATHELSDSFFGGKKGVSFEEIAVKLRESVIIPCVKEVFDEYLETIKKELGGEKDTLNFILQENEKELLEKSKKALGDTISRFFRGSLTVEIENLKVSGENHFRVEE